MVAKSPLKTASPRLGRERVVDACIAKVLTGARYTLLQRRFLGRKRDHVEVVVARQDGVALTIEDCSVLTRALSDLLQTKKTTAGQYAVEVASSPADSGLRKTLGSCLGEKLKIKTKRLMRGQRWFGGILMEATPTHVVIQHIDGSSLEIAREDIVEWRAVS